MMMKTGLMAVLALALLSGSALAAGGAKPTEAQKVEFHKVCMGIAKNEALCSCKAEAAMSLTDEDFMAEIIASMKGKAPPTGDNVKYARYIGQSNAKCIPGY
jgi:hypothetical protein